MYDMKSFIKKKKKSRQLFLCAILASVEAKEMEERAGNRWKDMVMNIQRFWNSHWSGTAAEDKE